MPGTRLEHRYIPRVAQRDKGPQFEGWTVCIYCEEI